MADEQLPQNSWQYTPAEASDNTTTEYLPPSSMSPQAVAVPPTGSEGTISWTASEFIMHDKSITWYVLLAAGTIVLAAFVWLVMKDMISVTVIVLCGAVFGYYATHKPRQLHYELNESGLIIENRFSSYNEFKSFAVASEGVIASIVFVPLKRFATMTTIYFDPADEEKIMAVLSARLPIEPLRRDGVDRLMNRIRF